MPLLVDPPASARRNCAAKRQGSLWLIFEPRRMAERLFCVMRRGQTSRSKGRKPGPIDGRYEREAPVHPDEQKEDAHTQRHPPTDVRGSGEHRNDCLHQLEFARRGEEKLKEARRVPSVNEPEVEVLASAHPLLVTVQGPAI